MGFLDAIQSYCDLTSFYFQVFSLDQVSKYSSYGLFPGFPNSD